MSVQRSRCDVPAVKTVCSYMAVHVLFNNVRKLTTSRENGVWSKIIHTKPSGTSHMGTLPFVSCLTTRQRVIWLISWLGSQPYIPVTTVELLLSPSSRKGEEELARCQQRIKRDHPARAEAPGSKSAVMPSH